MAEISFTANLRRHLSCPPIYSGGRTVREVLDDAIAENPPLRSYLVDEHGRLRQHVNVFINDRAVADRVGLTDAVSAEDRVYVFQALSGG